MPNPDIYALYCLRALEVVGMRGSLRRFPGSATWAGTDINDCPGGGADRAKDQLLQWSLFLAVPGWSQDNSFTR